MAAAKHTNELAVARVACIALGANDSLHLLMCTLLDTVEKRLTQADGIGLRPALPDRHKYLNKLAADNARRASRAAAFAAMDKLLATVWAPMTAAERKRRSLKRKRQREPLRLPDFSALAKQYPALQMQLPQHPALASQSKWRAPPALQAAYATAKEATFAARFLAPSAQRTIFATRGNPWADATPQLSFEPEPGADGPDGGANDAWWQRLEQLGLSPGHMASNYGEAEHLAAKGCARRHSV